MHYHTGYRAVLPFVLSLAFNCCLRAAPIHDAAQAGDVAKVSDLLAADPKLLNATDNYGRTPLIWAAQNGHIETVMLLLEKGAVVDGKRDLGSGALRRTVQRGHLEVAKVLLEKGAAVDTKDNQGNTPLSIAAENGYIELVELLQEKGAGWNTKKYQGLSPLVVAAQNLCTGAVMWRQSGGAFENVQPPARPIAILSGAEDGGLPVVGISQKKAPGFGRRKTEKTEA